MADAVDSGITRGFPQSVRSAWVFTLIAGVLSSVLLMANAIGLLTAERLGIEPNGSPSAAGRSLKVWHFVATYLGSLFLVTGLALFVETNYGFSNDIGLPAGCGVLFLVAASGRPWWLYATVRRLGWFAAISSDKWMKATLATIGALMLIISANSWLTR